MSDEAHVSPLVEDAVSVVSRRALLVGALGTATAALCRALPGQQQATAQGVASPPAPPLTPDPTHVPGHGTTAVGTRAPSVQLARAPAGIVSGEDFTPLQDLQGIITPSDLHYERHHAGVPTIDPDNYRLLIHGLVDRPLTLTLADLRRFPARSRICFLECSGNGRRGYRAMSPQTTPQQIDGLTSTSE